MSEDDLNADLHAQIADLTAMVRHLLDQQDQMRQETRPGRVAPDRRITVRDLVDKATRVTESTSLRTYRHGWKVLADGLPDASIPGHGDRFADEIQPSDLERLRRPIIDAARARTDERNLRRREVGRQPLAGTGASAWYNAVGSFRRLFAIALADGHVLSNPAASIRKRKTSARERWAIPRDRVMGVIDLAGAGGDDPELDRMVTVFHLVTGARQCGALALRLMDVSTSTCMVTLREKNGRVDAQPVPDWLARDLVTFATSRGAVHGTDPVFRKRRPNGTPTPIGPRRYNYLFERLQAADPWADEARLTAHVLRHTAGTFVERVGGPAVAQRFLRHASGSTTDGYTKATPAEVAEAVVAIWGGGHPMVHSPRPEV